MAIDDAPTEEREASRAAVEQSDGVVDGAGAEPLLKERAYGELKRRILSGAYPPRAFLSERKLAAQLHMSKTPVRAALERLAAEGFIAVSPQQGIVVREQSLREVVELFDLRIALETFVVRRLAGRLSAAHEQRLRTILAAQAEGVERHDIVQSAHLDAQLHLSLSEALDNREITQVMRHLRDKLDGIIRRILTRDVGRISSSYGEHVGIVEAVVSGEAELAATRMEQHLTWGKQFLVS